MEPQKKQIAYKTALKHKKYKETFKNAFEKLNVQDEEKFKEYYKSAIPEIQSAVDVMMEKTGLHMEIRPKGQIVFYEDKHGVAQQIQQIIGTNQNVQQPIPKQDSKLKIATKNTGKVLFDIVKYIGTSFIDNPIRTVKLSLILLITSATMFGIQLISQFVQNITKATIETSESLLKMLSEFYLSSEEKVAKSIESISDGLQSLSNVILFVGASFVIVKSLDVVIQMYYHHRILRNNAQMQIESDREALIQEIEERIVSRSQSRHSMPLSRNMTPLAQRTPIQTRTPFQNRTPRIYEQDDEIRNLTALVDELLRNRDQ